MMVIQNLRILKRHRTVLMSQIGGKLCALSLGSNRQTNFRHWPKTSSYKEKKEKPRRNFVQLWLARLLCCLYDKENTLLLNLQRRPNNRWGDSVLPPEMHSPTSLNLVVQQRRGTSLL
jgi:hypothetical protein